MKILTSCLVLLCALNKLFACHSGTLENNPATVIEIYSAVWKFHPGEGKDSLWRNPDYTDEAWRDVESDKTLSGQGITLTDGYGWYRKTIQFSDNLREAIRQSGAIILHPGSIAACDEVYVNGSLIGKTGQFPPDYMGSFNNKREYIVYEKDLNPDGDNLIAVKFNKGWSNEYGFRDNALLAISSATTNEKVRLQVNVEDEDYIFLKNDPLKIMIELQNTNTWDVIGKLKVTLTTDAYEPVSIDSIDVKLKGKEIFQKGFIHINPLPGFYRYTIQFIRENELVCEKKINVGYEPEKIVSPVDAQPDFEEFWDMNLTELAKIAPNYQLTLLPDVSTTDYDMYLVEMNSFGNELIRGYYSKPKKKGQHPVIIEYMGYGSEPYYPNRSWDGYAYFVLSIRGQALNKPYNQYGTWVNYGLDSEYNYYYRGAFLDVVRAIDFVCSRPEVDATRIGVKGGSQGGALSFVAAALDKRVTVAAPNIPFLSDYPDYFRIAPWPKNDIEKYIKENPGTTWEEILRVLSYFDIKNFAPRIECPLIMGIGVQDNVCPPHINFAAYNQVPSEKRWMAFPEFAHSVGRAYYEESQKFFGEKLNVPIEQTGINPEIVDLCTPNPSAQAVKVYEFLKEIQGQKTLSGAMANVSWNIKEANWIYNQTGKHPALACFDFIHLHSNRQDSPDYSDTHVVEEWWDNKGLVSAMWHWNVPLHQESEEFAFYAGNMQGKRKTDFDISLATCEGTYEYQVIKEDLEKVASYLLLLKNKNIPVIWRPLHEASGGWFWWGTKGPEPFKALWKLMYETFRQKGLNNLIWVWTTEGKDNEWFPGEEYVDIIGKDSYRKTRGELLESYQKLSRMYPDRLIALSECGTVPDIEEQWKAGARWLWFMPWYDYERTIDPEADIFREPHHKYADKTWWLNSLNPDYVLTREQLPSFK